MPNTGMWQQLLPLKVGHQKMLPEQDGFSEVSELSPGLFFATERVSAFFRLSYFDLLQNILGYLSPVAFSLALSYTVRLTTFVT